MLDARLLSGIWSGWVVAMLFLLLLSSSEEAMFDRIVLRSVPPGTSQQETATSLLHAAHALVENRNQWMDMSRGLSLTSRMLKSTGLAMVEGGDCGAFSAVLARALQQAGLEVRIAQMKVGEVWGGHIFVEADIDGRWVAFDPLYDLTYRRPDGRLASFEDIHGDWAYYSNQTPEHYNANYAYEDVRYTNWSRLPLLGGLISDALGIVIGEERARGFSLRSYLLDAGRNGAIMLALGALPLLWLSYRSRRRQQPS